MISVLDAGNFSLISFSKPIKEYEVHNHSQPNLFSSIFAKQFCITFCLLNVAVHLILPQSATSSVLSLTWIGTKMVLNNPALHLLPKNMLDQQ